MASGIYGRSDLTANSWTEIASPPGSGIKVTTINITNRTDASKKVRIGLASSTSVNDTDVIEYDVVIPANGVLERTGIVLDSSNGLYVYSNAAGCTAIAWGLDG